MLTGLIWHGLASTWHRSLWKDLKKNHLEHVNLLVTRSEGTIKAQ